VGCEDDAVKAIGHVQARQKSSPFQEVRHGQHPQTVSDGISTACHRAFPNGPSRISGEPIDTVELNRCAVDAARQTAASAREWV
jgi:hypothetical protein